MLKRSAKLRFMASTYVFPGGAVSTSDRDPKWLDFIPQSGNMGLTPSSSKAVPRPKLYKTDPEETVSRDLSLRISSIRECFEESGILLVEKDGQLIQGMASLIKLAAHFRMHIMSRESRLPYCNLSQS
jgi:nucleoside diphosphate-linked moiety X motif protein 19